MVFLKFWSCDVIMFSFWQKDDESDDEAFVWAETHVIAVSGS